MEVDWGVEAEFDVELALMADVGVAKESGDDSKSGVVFDVLAGVVGGGMRFAFRDVRSGEGVLGA